MFDVSKRRVVVSVDLEVVLGKSCPQSFAVFFGAAPGRQAAVKFLVVEDDGHSSSGVVHVVKTRVAIRRLRISSSRFIAALANLCFFLEPGKIFLKR